VGAAVAVQGLSPATGTWRWAVTRTWEVRPPPSALRACMHPRSRAHASALCACMSARARAREYLCVLACARVCLRLVRGPPSGPLERASARDGGRVHPSRQAPLGVQAVRACDRHREAHPRGAQRRAALLDCLVGPPQHPPSQPRGAAQSAGTKTANGAPPAIAAMDDVRRNTCAPRRAYRPAACGAELNRPRLTRCSTVTRARPCGRRRAACRVRARELFSA
jgi:hypothetical protein